MIKTSELRIGNVVLYSSNANHIVRITTIGGKTALNQFFVNLDKGGNHHIPDEHLRPIPLTPEIIEKCGFERDDEEDCNGYFAYRPDTAHYAMRLFINDKGHVCAHYLRAAISTNHPQYLHQLQNLYFALTNEELEVKL